MNMYRIEWEYCQDELHKNTYQFILAKDLKDLMEYIHSREHNTSKKSFMKLDNFCNFENVLVYTTDDKMFSVKDVLAHMVTMAKLGIPTME